MSRVRSREPVSTTTISSTRPAIDRRQSPRNRSSSRAISVAESWMRPLPDEALIPEPGQHLRDLRLGWGVEAVRRAQELGDPGRRVLAGAQLQDDDGGVVEVVDPVALGLVDHEPVLDLVDLDAA